MSGQVLQIWIYMIKFICIMIPNNEILHKIIEKFLINMENIRGHL